MFSNVYFVESEELDVVLVESDSRSKLEFVRYVMLRRIADDHDEPHYHMSKAKQ